MGKQETMQDQTGAHSPDQTALSGHRPSRELAPHPPHQHTYYKMGNEEMGRDSSRFRKKGIKYSSLFTFRPETPVFIGIPRGEELFLSLHPLFTTLHLQKRK